jgi:tagatose-6-phosphate ketose/aldose isomerase
MEPERLTGRSAARLEELGARWTASEIAQQPRLWAEVGASLAGRREEIAAFTAAALADPRARVVLTGAGTSAFAGELLAPALGRRLRRRVDAVATTDVVADPEGCFPEDVPTLLVSFARSGDSPESLAATELAARRLPRLRHLVVTCNADGGLHRAHADAEGSLSLVMPPEADDRGFAMTSSFTCMVLAASLALGGATGAPPERLAAAAEDLLAATADGVRAVAGGDLGRIVYLGSGPLKGLAREASLKVLELTAGRTAAFHDSALGFRHGPKAVLDEHTAAVVLLSNDPYTRRYDEDILAELRDALGADRVIAAGAGADGPGAWRVEGLDDASDDRLALPLAACAQLLALERSLALGLTPDDPFPAGQVNRVVQGVTIHGP